MINAGSVRVGTLYDFRRIESLGAERGDQDEGIRISLTDGKAAVVEGKDLPWFVQEALDVPHGVKLQFNEGAVLEVHQNAPDCYVYCTCSQFDRSDLKPNSGSGIISV